MTAHYMESRMSRSSYDVDNFIFDLFLVPITIGVLDPINIVTLGSLMDFDGNSGWGVDSSGNITEAASGTYENLGKLGGLMYMDRN
jgi:hypothetical protein